MWFAMKSCPMYDIAVGASTAKAKSLICYAKLNRSHTQLFRNLILHLNKTQLQMQTKWASTWKLLIKGQQNCTVLVQ